MSVTVYSTTNGIQASKEKENYAVQLIAESAANGFFTVDRNWIVKSWNKAAEQILGVLSKSIMYKNIWEEFAAIIPVNFYAVYHKAFLQDIPIHFQEYWGEMGAWFDVITFHSNESLSVSFKKIDAPVLSGELAFQNEAQQLKTLNELYRLITEVTNDCLWEWDLLAKKIFWIDGGHERVFGYPIKNALIPQSFWENCLHPDDKESVLARLEKAISEGTGHAWEDEYRFKKINGEYAYVHDCGHIIYDKKGRAVRMIGATSDVTEKVLLENKLAAERISRQREITEAMLTGQENERKWIGREMHDNLNQLLAVAKLYIQMAKKPAKSNEGHLDKSLDYIARVMEEIRRISKTLVIHSVHIIGLFDNIRNLVKDLSGTHPIKIKFHAEGIQETDLDEKIQLNIYRVVQEQLNNILKHSKATTASIKIKSLAGSLLLVISDNGIGSNRASKKEGIGLINIRSRAELYHGSMDIKTEPGKGYELRVIFQLNPISGNNV